MAERLNRFLARAGVASRREADRLIAAGRIRVNGVRPPATGQLVTEGQDRVTLDGRPVLPRPPRTHLLMNKPAGHLVTRSDPEGRPTVFDLVDPTVAGSGRLFPVGRLDVDTTGLLILTDDGELAHRLMHPAHEVEKEYLALVEGTVGRDELRQLEQGIELEDGPTAPCRVTLLERRPGGVSVVSLVIHEGRQRQVRRMLEAVGHPVRELTRVRFGPLRLGRLKPGHTRRLRDQEVKSLRAAVGLS